MGMLDFLKKPSEPKILSIQKRDMDISKLFFDIVLQIGNNLSSLKNALEENKVSVKYARIAELENSFLRLKSKVETLEYDLDAIITLESRNKVHILFNDEELLNDKKEALNEMNHLLDELLEILNQKPSVNDLREEGFEYINVRVNSIIENIRRIVQDDNQLYEIYSSLQNL